MEMSIGNSGDQGSPPTELKCTRDIQLQTEQFIENQTQE